VYRIGAAILIAAGLCGATAPLSAQELLEATEEELVAREQVRSAVETALANYSVAPSSDRVEVALESIRSLEPFGEAVIPYLANELEQDRTDNFDFVAYALGFLNFPGSADALWNSITRAEETPGTAALTRKAWACWALGLNGEIGALEEVNSGRHRSGHISMHASTTALEAIALQTAPEVVPILVAQYDLWAEAEDEEVRADRRWVLRALRRVGDPAAIPKLGAIVATDEDPSYRAQAALALRSMETTESIEALLGALADEDPLVRRAASFALEWMMPPIDATPILEVLETETDPKARGALYRVAAATIRTDQTSRLLAQRNQPDAGDRRMFVKALGELEGDDIDEVIAASLEDPRNTVVLTTIELLANSGKAADRERLLAVFDGTSNPLAVQVIAETAGEQGWSEFAPIAARRLLAAASVDPTDRPGVRTTVDKLTRSLVRLRYTTALAKLRRSRKTVDDSIVAGLLDRAITQLELLRKNGKSVSKWIALAADSDSDLRRLAWSRLADLGDEAALDTLVSAFDDAEDAERWELLLLLEGLDTPQTRSLLRRLLLEPKSTPGLRDQAAWNARRIGGAEMFELLTQSIVVRDGRDAKVMVYAAALGGEPALPFLRDYRLVRMRYLSYTRGKEQEVLDWIAQQLESGRPIGRYDLPPHKLVFR